jgi:hypothetical protein
MKSLPFREMIDLVAVKASAVEKNMTEKQAEMAERFVTIC